jgi:hypothetical protein
MLLKALFLLNGLHLEIDLLDVCVDIGIDLPGQGELLS